MSSTQDTRKHTENSLQERTPDFRFEVYWGTEDKPMPKVLGFSKDGSVFDTRSDNMRALIRLAMELQAWADMPRSEV